MMEFRVNDFSSITCIVYTRHDDIAFFQEFFICCANVPIMEKKR